MSFLDEFQASMRRVGEKQVTRTDVGKAAYVPSASQRLVMADAGHEPEPHTNGRLITIRVAGTNEILETSYYPSVRSGSGREPEVRMGRGLVNWVQEGETLWLGTNGTTVFALKSSALPFAMGDQEQIDEATENLSRFLDPREVLDRARASLGPPDRHETRSVAFERNPWVREFARRRSGGRCEIAGCGYVGFKMADGRPYIEVHHIQSMSAAGHDVIENVAAICPNCHAHAHYGKDRETIQAQLLEAIGVANKLYLPTIQ